MVHGDDDDGGSGEKRCVISHLLDLDYDDGHGGDGDDCGSGPYLRLLLRECNLFRIIQTCDNFEGSGLI